MSEDQRDRVSEAAKRRAYVMLEPYLSGFRVCVGFEDRDAASDFQEAISRATLSQSTGDTK